MNSVMFLTIRSSRSLSILASSSRFPIMKRIPTRGVVRSCAVAARKSSRLFAYATRLWMFSAAVARTETSSSGPNIQKMPRKSVSRMSVALA